MSSLEQKYLENAKLLYEISRYEYESELTRSTKLDEKVNKILTFESVIIVAFTALTTNSSIIELLNNKHSVNLIYSYGLVIIFIVIIAISLYILIDCLALRNMEKLHVDEAMCLRIGCLDNPDAYIEVVSNYSSITEINKKSNDAKAKKLFKNHNLLFLALFVICLYASSLLIAFLTPDKSKINQFDISNLGLQSINLYFSELKGEGMSEDKIPEKNKVPPPSTPQPDPATIFSFANKQKHSTSIALEDFSGGGVGNLLLENQK